MVHMLPLHTFCREPSIEASEPFVLRLLYRRFTGIRDHNGVKRPQMEP